MFQIFQLHFLNYNIFQKNDQHKVCGGLLVSNHNIISSKTNLQFAINTEDNTNTQSIPKDKLSTPINSNFDSATRVFNAQSSLGDYSKRCKTLKYFAFKVGYTEYLTAYQHDAKLETIFPGNGPKDSQLFEGIQNMDGTWAFKVKNQNKYLRADANGITINYQTYIGPWERWWVERNVNKGSSHIQSAQFSKFYWVFKGGLLQQSLGSAASITLQFWPQLNWGWSW